MNRLYVWVVLLLLGSSAIEASDLWTSSIAGNGRDTVTSVSANKNLICVAGNSQGGTLQYSGISAKGQQKIASHETDVNEKSAVLICTSAIGELVYFNDFIGKGVVQINDLSMNDKDEIYLAGYFANQFELPNKLGLHSSTTTILRGQSGVDGFVAKYDSAGDLQWAKTIRNKTGAQFWQALTVSGDQPGVVMQGTFHHSVTLPNGDVLKGTAAKNHFIVRMSDTGDVLWQQQWSVEQGKVGIGGLALDQSYIYESFAHESPVVISNKNTDLLVIKRNLQDGTLVWDKQFSVKGSGFATNPVIQVNGNISVGITFQNQLTLQNSALEVKSSGHSDLMLVTLDGKDGHTIDAFQFGDSGSETMVELSIHSDGRSLLFSYYQILPEAQKVNYAMGIYDSFTHVNRILPSPQFLSRDFSVQSQALLNNEIITAGVVFRKKGQTYKEPGKINSVKKSDIYINYAQL